MAAGSEAHTDTVSNNDLMCSYSCGIMLAGNLLPTWQELVMSTIMVLRPISFNLPPVNPPTRLWLHCNNYVTTWSHSCATTFLAD